MPNYRIIFYFYKKKQGYSLFIEFSHAYGLKDGTKVHFRGVQVGYVKNLQMQLNSVIALVYIRSPKILIPKNSLIEVNQSGLFNDTVIEIVPTTELYTYFTGVDNKICDVFANKCLNSEFLCNYHLLHGERGINYDDLIRATTRISQRFDDPRFFSLFYLFLQNSFDISDELILIITNFNSIIFLFIRFIRINLNKYLL